MSIKLPFLHFLNTLIHILSFSYVLGSLIFFNLVTPSIKNEDKKNSVKLIYKFTNFLPFFLLVSVATNIIYILLDESFLTILRKNSNIQVLTIIYILFFFTFILLALYLQRKVDKLLKINIFSLIEREWRRIRIDLSVLLEFEIVIVIVETLILYFK
ncbi:MAG TPA: hypothetical protein PKW23_04945 [Dictyoglomaceae bacterium]|nr:hypothetical protein [Dictyoglomaceae bacterium]HPP16118.1 hypothetical protein [Dictyoglomaceae bacterium]